MAERFYVNCPLEAGVLVLQGAEAHHVVTVRRFRPGEQVYLFNGDGREYRAEVTAIQRHEVELNVLGSTAADRELPFQLIVACPLPKGDRGQFLVEKLTELGVTTYVPLRTQRSVIHPGENRLEKLQRYVIEASKQCGRNVLMRIEPVTDWSYLAKSSDLPARRLVAHLVGLPLGKVDLADTVCAIGPEGGFAAEEVELAQRAGWQLVHLGPRTLRVETAALIMATAVSLPPGAGSL